MNAGLVQLEAADKRSRSLFGPATSNSEIPLGEDLKEAVQLIPLFREKLKDMTEFARDDPIGQFSDQTPQ